MTPEEMEQNIEEAQKDIESMRSNLLLLNSSFSGLQISYKFIMEALQKIEKSVEQRNKDARKVEQHFLRQIADLSAKLDRLMEKIEGEQGNNATDTEAA